MPGMATEDEAAMAEDEAAAPGDDDAIDMEVWCCTTTIGAPGITGGIAPIGEGIARGAAAAAARSRVSAVSVELFRRG